MCAEWEVGFSQLRLGTQHTGPLQNQKKTPEAEVPASLLGQEEGISGRNHGSACFYNQCCI